MKFSLLLFFSFTIASISAQNTTKKTFKTNEIRIRDPFIYADKETQKYYMYAQMDNRLGFRGDDNKIKGVEVYISSDLENWQSPETVLELPEKFWGRNMVWAPEMHKYKNKYYLFATITSSEVLTDESTPEGEKNWPEFNKRGTQIFVSDSPLGPFKFFENKPHTPAEWMALDGTLYEEDGKPYMIFCHEWVQIRDGSMNVVELSSDLSKPVGKPELLFHASEAAWGAEGLSKVTDGCFMYKTKMGKLLMIWSSFGEKGYAIGIAESKTGKLKGPWIQQDNLLFKENGGHGMLFHTFENKLMLVFHQPNSPREKERMKMFEITDNGNTLQLKNK